MLDPVLEVTQENEEGTTPIETPPSPAPAPPDVPVAESNPELEHKIARLVVNKLDALFGIKDSYTEEEIYTAFSKASEKPHYRNPKTQKVADRLRNKLATESYLLQKNETPTEKTD